MEKGFYDLVHEAYMTGKNPDAVSEDAYDMHRDRGFQPDEITVKMVTPSEPRRRPIPEPEQVCMGCDECCNCYG